MAKQLLVILGAGASFDCASARELPGVRMNRRPPLVSELFARDYQDILNTYPLAQAAATNIRSRLGGGALGLEDLLRDELRASPHSHVRAQYWSLPLYFQELLLACSFDYTAHPDNLDQLTSELLKLDRVVFITFNYDTIFDRVLEKYHRLDSLDAYISNPRVVLIKLHGSVTWGRRLLLAGEIGALAEDGFGLVCHGLAENPDTLDPTILFLARPAGQRDVQSLRTVEHHLYYPALAAPLGPADEVSCPPEHLLALQQSLDPHSYGYDLHLLVIGYSCLDTRLLELIGNSGSRIASAVIVNGSAEQGRLALERLQRRLLAVAPREDRDFVSVFDGGLGDFVRSDHLPLLIERIPSA